MVCEFHAAKKTGGIFYFRKFLFEIWCHKNRHRWRNGLITTHRHIIIDAIDVIFFRMKLIKAQLIFYK